MKETMGWIVWGILALFAVSWGIGCHNYIHRGIGLHRGTLNTTILWSILALWCILFPEMNKLHILWLAPTLLAIAGFLSIAYASFSTGRRIIIPGFVLLVIGGFLL